MLKGPRFSHLGPFIFLSLVHQLLHQLEFHWSTNFPTNFSGVPTNYFREPFSILASFNETLSMYVNVLSAGRLAVYVNAAFHSGLLCM